MQIGTTGPVDEAVQTLTDTLLCCRLRYDDELFKLLDRLIKDMDRKIEKAKERAEAESRPKVLRPEDQKRLDDIQERIKGVHRLYAGYYREQRQQQSYHV